MFDTYYDDYNDENDDQKTSYSTNNEANVWRKNKGSQSLAATTKSVNIFYQTEPIYMYTNTEIVYFHDESLSQKVCKTALYLCLHN